MIVMDETELSRLRRRASLWRVTATGLGLLALAVVVSPRGIGR